MTSSGTSCDRPATGIDPSDGHGRYFSFRAGRWGTSPTGRLLGASRPVPSLPPWARHRPGAASEHPGRAQMVQTWAWNKKHMENHMLEAIALRLEAIAISTKGAQNSTSKLT